MYKSSSQTSEHLIDPLQNLRAQLVGRLRGIEADYKKILSGKRRRRLIWFASAVALCFAGGLITANDARFYMIGWAFIAVGVAQFAFAIFDW